jgi:cytochrome P450
MLGVPREDGALLKPWVDDLALVLGVIKGMKRASASSRELEAHMMALIAERPRARARTW